MKVCILGLARSGTTAVYSLLQEIMIRNHKSVDFVYEPFLWKKDIFNSRYDEVDINFKYNDSISIEGILNHMKLPLFISNPSKYKSNKYLKQVFTVSANDKNVLAKYIRANGRYPLLKSICPDCKFIFTIRNPIDSIYSIISWFSYFGGEFHTDDYHRFNQEVRSIYKINLDNESSKGRIEKELEYWYYMNKFALESFVDTKPKPIIICHEEYKQNREDIIKRVCKYLDYEFDQNYLDTSEKISGAVTKSHNLSNREIEILSAYWDKYLNLLGGVGIQVPVDLDTILSKYNISETLSVKENRYYGLNPLYINHKVNELEKRIDDQLSNIEKKNQIINENNSKIKDYNAIIKEKVEQINNYQKILKEGEELSKKWESIFKDKNEVIINLEKTIEQKNNLINEKDIVRKNMELSLKDKDNVISQKDSVIEEKNSAIEKFEVSLKDKDNVISQKDSIIEEKNSAIEKFEVSLKDKDNVISQKDSIIEEKNNTIKKLESSVINKDELIEDLNLKINEIQLSLDKEREKIVEISKNLQMALIEQRKLETRINLILNSLSWKIGYKLSSLYHNILFWIPKGRVKY